ncbi:DEKNAAC103811 [Brettanomyces naardenensis]|uniref:Sulfate adenylyltransferase n=1 Tax=Brettanomyces naardenensis TaxID=13370 RepID=A0A448YPD5_BRENA|nr:DEKNAAC103811 [Brettanomyces naardenensis]
MLPPHGGVLQDLIQRDLSRRDSLIKEAEVLESIVLTDRQICDLELIINGGFSPLTGFLNQKDYESVVHKLRLSSGTIWTIPITLDVNKEIASSAKAGKRFVLRDPRDDAALAIITVEDVYKPDKAVEAKEVFRGDPDHPAVRYLYDVAGDYYIGGPVEAISLPRHFDYTEFRKTPAQLRAEFAARHWGRVVAFQTRNPMHRAHRELTVRAARDKLANLLIHPVVGLTKPGDIDHHTRVKVYQEIIKKYPPGMAELSLLPLAMRMAGDREAVWHSIIRKNYGATHFIVGRDHAGPGKNHEGVPFYGPYDAQDLVKKFADELGIQMVPFRMVTYLPDEDRYAPIDTVSEDTRTLNISGTELRSRLKTGAKIPDWFSYPEVVNILRTSHPPRPRQGFAIYLTGLPYSGVSALGYALQATLNQFQGGRHITLLDGLNIPRETYPVVISELIRAHAGVIVANADEKEREIPTAEQIVDLKNSVSKSGTFVLLSVETPLKQCLKNDRFGFYKAHPEAKDFKAPEDVDIKVDLSDNGIYEAIQKVILFLEEEGFYEF